MANDKFLLFTWQPTCICYKGTGAFTGCPDAPISKTHDKVNKRFVFDLTDGARLTHNRQWELLEIKALLGTVEVYQLLNDGITEVLIDTITTDRARRDFNILCACETLIFKTLAGPTEFCVVVREYQSHTRGN